MARKPSAKKVAKAIQGLHDALKFIEPASAEIGQANQTHCMMAGNWVSQFNGLLMMAAKIDTDIVAYPNTKRLLAVLSRCSEATQITQLDSGRLGVKSGKFQAFVPCIDAGLIQMTGPDAPQYPINPAVIEALKCVGIIAKENAPRMVQASVLLRHNSAVATDGAMAMESWHGTPLPTVVLPKVFVTELLKIGKTPKFLGASPATCTVWFEDESFIRTQLYTEPYPDVDRVLNTPNSAFGVPPEFWAALDKIEAMKDEQTNVYFNAGGAKLQTSEHDNVGASCEYDGPLPHGLLFDIDRLRRFAPFAKSADWAAGTEGKCAVLYGEGFRGVLMQKRLAGVGTSPGGPQPLAPLAPVPNLTAGYTPSDITGNPMDDEIPF